MLRTNKNYMQEWFYLEGSVPEGNHRSVSIERVVFDTRASSYIYFNNALILELKLTFCSGYCYAKIVIHLMR